MFIEDLGRAFKGDPTFGYLFNHLTSGQLMYVYELRKKHLEKNPSLDGLL